MKRGSLVILLASLCAVSSVQATTYVRVEKDGTKTYSDRPMPGGQPIDLQPAQSYSAPTSQAAVDPNLPSEQQLLQQVDNFRYDSCPVTEPANDATFQNPQAVSISLTTAPGLRPGDIITLTLDGQPVGGANPTGYLLSPAYRGTHVVGVTVKNVAGKVLCSSTSSFHVLRPSLNSPARR